MQVPIQYCPKSWPQFLKTFALMHDSNYFLRIIFYFLLVSPILAWGIDAQSVYPKSGSSIERSNARVDFISSGAGQYYVYVGTGLGGLDVYSENLNLKTSFVIPRIPIDIEKIYVRIWALNNQRWSSVDVGYSVAALRYQPILSGRGVDNNLQVFGRAWQQPVNYSDANFNVNCQDQNASNFSSGCMLSISAASRIDPPYLAAIGNSAANALVAKLAIKLKAFSFTENSYCQIAIAGGSSVPNALASDYLVHTESFLGAQPQIAGRKVGYVVIPIVLDSNGFAHFRIEKEIIGQCEVSVAMSFVGFYK